MKLVPATLALFLCLQLSSPQSLAACTVKQAIRAEAQLQKLKSWDDAAKYYSSFQVCIDGGVSEAFTDFITMRLAQSNGMSSFWKETKKEKWFREVVVKRIQSNTVSAEAVDAIRQNASSDCPNAARAFCRRLQASIER